MSTRAQLSSITSSLAEIQHRVSELAEEARALGDDETASELFNVERSLIAALRRLGRLMSSSTHRS
jgi:hypothetical protein